jgi:hypothetical protein
VIVSFSIDDLKQSVPGAADIAALAGDELSDALRCLLGKAFCLRKTKRRKP